MKRIAKFHKVSWEQFRKDWVDTFGEQPEEKIREIYEGIKLPKRATRGSAGYDFFTPQKTNVSYSIAALNPAYEVLVSGKHSNNFAPISSDTKENQLCNLDPDKLKECFEMTLEALEKALRFIENNDLEKYNRSDYVNYLIGYFVFHKEKISEQQKNNLIDWYNNVTFTNKSNTTRRRIYSDLLNL